MADEVNARAGRSARREWQVLLEGKSAVVYGAGGAVGAAVAKAFAAEGARVALTGRTVERLEAVRAEVVDAGGDADVAVVDAFDRQAVESHLAQFVRTAGRVDIAFNAVSPGYVIGDPLTDETVEDVFASVGAAIRTQFVTAVAAVRHMARAGSGVILTIIAPPARVPMPNQGSLGVVGAATEALYRQLAVDLGPQGVRLICLLSAGSSDAPGVDYAMTISADAAGISREEFEHRYAEGAALKRLPRLDEVGAVAALMASDRASAVTATVANVTCGQIAT